MRVGAQLRLVGQSGSSNSREAKNRHQAQHRLALAAELETPGLGRFHRKSEMHSQRLSRY